MNLLRINPALHHLVVPIESVVPDPENLRSHGGPDDFDMRRLVESFRKHGQQKPVVLYPGGKITVAGAGMLQAMEILGFDAVAVLNYNGTEEMARQYGIEDNRTAELSWWNEDALKKVATDSPELRQLMEELAMQDFFTEKKSDNKRAANDDVDYEIEMLMQKWLVRVGQTWKLGNHVLMCADARIGENRGSLLSGVEDKNMAFVTDPPYGINVQTGWWSNMHIERGGTKCKNDSPLECDDGSLDLSWIYRKNEWLVFGFPFVSRNEDYSGLLIWDKRGDGGERGIGCPVEVAASNAFNGYRLVRHIWAGYVKEAGEKREPIATQKPVGVMIDAIRLVHAAIIVDPFVGSGTTIMACEEIGKTCLAMDIKPAHIAICLERWLRSKKESPTLLTDVG